MKHLSLIFILFYTTILISCQNSKKDLDFIKEIKLPYTIEIPDYDKFVKNSFEKKEVFDYNNLSNIMGKHTNISKIYFIGKFLVDKQEFVLYQDVSPNESADFFPAIYLAKIGENIKTLCLTPNNEESYIDKITIRNNRIILRENYWDSEEKKRKNNKIKEYNFDFTEIKAETKKISNIVSSSSKLDQLIQSKSVTDSLILKKDCDLNMDTIKDKILVFTPRKANTENRFSTIYILIYKKSGEFTEYSNSKIINSYNPNSYAEGFHDIAIKNNYFTVEENISSQPIQNKYTTFIFDKKNNAIYLHKLGFSTIYPDANQDKDVVYSTKDFGINTFENYNSETIKY